jgi:hypothetical protein
VPTILSRSRVGENIARHRGKAEGVIEFLICEQSASEVATDPRN